MKQLNLFTPFKAVKYRIQYADNPSIEDNWTNYERTFQDLVHAKQALETLSKNYNGLFIKIMDQNNFIYFVYDPRQNPFCAFFDYTFARQYCEQHQGIYEVNGTYHWNYDYEL